MKTLITGILISLIPFTSYSQLTIEECVRKAEANYPLIKKYELLDASLDIDLSEINKAWLPRLGAYGQVTTQNVVPHSQKHSPECLTKWGKK